jgi:AraC family transcriptional regulator
MKLENRTSSVAQPTSPSVRSLLLYDIAEDDFLVKIATELELALARRAESGSSAQLSATLLAEGNGWKVKDMVCTSGPQDRPYEEQHQQVSIAIVATGSFQYRASLGKVGKELMTTGSVLFGNAGQYFECSHEHGEGDRCVSFRFDSDYFESMAAEAGARWSTDGFGILRLPPVRDLSPLIARACAGLAGYIDVSWDELSIQLAVQALQLSGRLARVSAVVPPAAISRVTQIVRMVDRTPEARLTLAKLSDEAGLSRYHFLRTFERLTGVTPHQYVLRTRLREAAIRVASTRQRILDIALDSGFGDVSNFNRAFRTEYGVSPRVYRNGR